MAATDGDGEKPRAGTGARSIHNGLSRATCALLGLGAQPALALEPWEIDIGLLNYIEEDRNTGLEFLLDARRQLAGGDEVGFGVEIDTLTGATPNGATASNVVQTFTQSSGDGSYRVGPGELPADDTHMDTRLAIEADYLNRLDNDRAVGFSGHLSMEFDYLSFGAGNDWQWQFNQRNTTLDLGFYAEYNRVHPVGSVPLALTTMNPPGTLQNRREASVSRDGAEIGFGVTQVLDAKSLFQWRVTQSRFSGYLNDPYKLLSVVDDQNAGSLGATVEYRFENRPGSRDIRTFYTAYKRDFDNGIFDLSLRLSDDDWGIDATTLDLRYRFRLSGKAYLQPRIRIYRQDEADFFRHSLRSSETLPDFASADFRLAEFDAYTLGIKYGFEGDGGNRHAIVAEYYTQEGDSSPDDAVGLQRDQDLFPTLRTLVLRYLFSTRW